MGINVVDNAASHAASAAISTQAILSQANQLDQKKGTQTVKAPADLPKMKDLLGARRSQTGLKLLSGLLSKLASYGVKPLNESFGKVANKQTLNSKQSIYGNVGSEEDIIDLQNPSAKVARRLHDQRQGGGQSKHSQGQLVLDEEGKETLAEYHQTYIEFLVGSSPESKKKLDQLNRVLEDKGISQKDLKAIQSKAARSVRSEVTKQIRDAYLQKFVSKEKSLDFILNHKQLLQTLEKGMSSFKLRGQGLAGRNDNFQNTIIEAISQAKAKVADYVRDEAERLLVQEHLNPKNRDKELKNLLELGFKAGLNLKALVTKLNQQKIDLGMTPFAEPQNSLLTGNGANGQQNQDQPYEPIFDADDEKELLINSLRSLYMQRALRGDLYTKLKTSYKMRKLKNGIIRLGVAIEDFKKLESDGIALARAEFLKMLRNFYLERAFFYKLSGPAYKLLERKIKSALSNLARLNFPINADEQKRMIDDANRQAYDEVRKELIEIAVTLKLRQHASLTKRRDLLTKIAVRILDETKITNGQFDPLIAENITRERQNYSLIAEAA